MNSIEKIFGQVMNIGKVSFDTLVVNGTKNPSNDMRLDAYYYNEFDSQKYTNIDRLNQLNIRNNPYFVMSYSDKDENGKFFKEEVWMNPKQFDNFKEFLTSAYDDISSNASKIYGKGKINSEYEEYLIQTGYDENDGSGFGNIDSLGHIIFIYPTVIVTENNKDVYNGIAICIEDKDGNQYGQEMAINTFYTLVTTLNNYNIYTDSRLIAIQGLLYQILNGGGGRTSTSNSISRRPSGLTPRVRKPIQRRKTLSEALEEVDDEEEIESVEEPEEEVSTPKKTVARKSVSKKKIAKKPDKKESATLSMAEIIDESEDIVLDLDDDDEEF